VEESAPIRSTHHQCGAAETDSADELRFVLIVLSHAGRRLVHFNVTQQPTARWTARF
jgi:hypothetical protein